LVSIAEKSCCNGFAELIESELIVNELMVSEAGLSELLPPDDPEA
jgi:hypothetical protein